MSDLDEFSSPASGGMATMPKEASGGMATTPKEASGSVGRAMPPSAAVRAGAFGGIGGTDLIIHEQPGESFAGPAVAPESARDHDEVVRPAGDPAGESVVEASRDQMQRAESSGGTALSDLESVEGFVIPSPAAEAAAEDGMLRDAGSALEGQAEFLPALPAIAMSLISTIGPSVAKAAIRRLSPRAQSLIRRIPSIGPIPGSAIRAGASSAVKLLGKLFEVAEQEETESAAPVDEAQVAQVAALLEVIVDRDDRVRITSTTSVPWMRICALRITFPSGATYRGTGFFIGARAVATAGHCVYLHNQGGWARKVEVIPGCNGTVQPFGKAESSNVRSVGGWVNERKSECDYGCIILPAGAFGGRNLGSFGVAAFEPAEIVAQPAVVAGYPGDKPFAELWGAARFIKSVGPRTLSYDTATMGGQSGAGVYITRNGQRYVVGIHNYGASTGNTATRVTREVLARLMEWSKL